MNNETINSSNITASCKVIYVKTYDGDVTAFQNISNGTNPYYLQSGCFCGVCGKLYKTSLGLRRHKLKSMHSEAKQ